MASIKASITQWVLELIQKNNIHSKEESLKGLYHYFKIEGFCDEPQIFLLVDHDGLEWGYDSVTWDHPAIPTPTKLTTRKVLWETLAAMDQEEKKEKIIDTTIKAINSKKREYRRCKLCNQKMHSNEFYDRTTCFKCAEKHFGIYIVY